MNSHKDGAALAFNTDNSIPLQPASLDIWQTKYQLKNKAGEAVDKTIDDSYRRVAKALANVESREKRQQVYKDFLWALEQGSIPAGRIISNAGAHEHKPATSTINCTVSDTIYDSMDDILGKTHEAGLTLKAGCGIGYEFSTLRLRGWGWGNYFWPAVVYGYLRQDVLYRFICRRSSRGTNGNLRCKPPRRTRVYSCQT